MNTPSTWRLVRRNLARYRRTNIAVCLSVAVTVAVMVGALSVGDSIEHTLRSMARTRLGQVRSVCVSHDGFFSASLADRLSEKSEGVFAPVLRMEGVVTNSDETRRANAIQLLGTDGRFFDLSPSGADSKFTPPGKHQVAINTPLAGS